MRDVLDLSAVLDRFRGHFVLLDQCKFGERNQLTHGRVLRTSPDRDEVYDALRAHPNSVIIFTGPLPEDEEGAFLDAGEAWGACTVD